MMFIINFKKLDTKMINNEKYSLYLNESGTNLNSFAGPD
jgi:hypothetical protein